ncbi:MAG: phenylphosphate synthase subunit beta [Rhodospirillaceae bacterium]|nr:phenylphosphate synthase subunit beta [Rhodospirillaceae bacterium]
MSTDAPVVCWFEEVNKGSVDLVGGKCSSLGELINAGIRVPPGFAVTTEGYRRFMDEANISGKIFKRLEGLDHEDMAALESASEEIRGMIEAAPFSIDFQDDVGEYYRQLSTICSRPAVPVAVRSSATAEDLPDASFAGQQDTFLWVRGIDDVLDYTKKCFSSLFTGRAISYRIKMDFPHDQVAISVGVQKMANSHTAGVMFTINPTNGDRSSMMINASFGFGEAVVSGEVTPDEFLVNKISMETLDRTITRKEVYYTVNYETQSSHCIEVPHERQSIQSIVDEEVLELAKMGKLIEQHYGRPMDIEWAVDADMPAEANIFILQARPETVWSSKKKEPVAKKGTAMDHILSSLMKGQKVS